MPRRCERSSLFACREFARRTHLSGGGGASSIPRLAPQSAAARCVKIHNYSLASAELFSLSLSPRLVVVTRRRRRSPTPSFAGTFLRPRGEMQTGTLFNRRRGGKSSRTRGCRRLTENLFALHFIMFHYRAGEVRTNSRAGRKLWFRGRASERTNEPGLRLEGSFVFQPGDPIPPPLSPESISDGGRGKCGSDDDDAVYKRPRSTGLSGVVPRTSG